MMRECEVEVPDSIEIVQIYLSKSTNTWHESWRDIDGDYEKIYAFKFYYPDRMEYAPLFKNGFVPLTLSLKKIKEKALAKLTDQEKLILGLND